MDFVSAGKNALLLLYVTVCEKVVPRLNKHDDVIEWNSWKIAPSEMKSWLRPWSSHIQSFIISRDYTPCSLYYCLLTSRISNYRCCS